MERIVAETVRPRPSIGSEVSAVPSPCAAAVEEISSQDAARSRIRELLRGCAEDLASEGITRLYEQRPERDRNSGTSWRGIETICHISALLASPQEMPEHARERRRLLDALGRGATFRDLRRRHDRLEAPLPRRVWSTRAGDRLEVACGVRLTMRAISAPYLPGSLRRAETTSPLDLGHGVHGADGFRERPTV